MKKSFDMLPLHKERILSTISVILTLALLFFLTQACDASPTRKDLANAEQTLVSAQQTLAALQTTATAFVQTAAVAELDRAYMIQQTTTALATLPPALPPEIAQSIVYLMPGSTTGQGPELGTEACTGTVLRAEEYDHDHDSQTPKRTLYELVTIQHCLEAADSIGLFTQTGQSSPGIIVGEHIFDETPNARGDYAIVVYVAAQLEYLSVLQSLIPDLSLSSPSSVTDSLVYCGYPGALNPFPANPILRCETLSLFPSPTGYYTMFPVSTGHGDSGAPVISLENHTIVCVTQGLADESTGTTTTSFCAPLPASAQNTTEAIWNQLTTH